MEIDAENLSATELRLGLPGTSSSDDDINSRAKKSSAKRTLDDTRSEAASGTDCPARDDHDDTATPAKAQVVGWPPVRAYRKNAFHHHHQAASSASASATKKADQSQPAAGTGLYVKVSMDGAPYLRKVDLRMYKGYRELRDALDALFFKTTTKSSFSADGDQQHAVAYEDKDGDLMLVGDVPWEMFVNSCKKLRIMKGAEATR